MSANVELFRQIVERGFNRGDLSVADELCALPCAEHRYLPPTNVSGPEILKIEIQAPHEVRCRRQGVDSNACAR